MVVQCGLRLDLEKSGKGSCMQCKSDKICEKLRCVIKRRDKLSKGGIISKKIYKIGQNGPNFKNLSI